MRRLFLAFAGLACLAAAEPAAATPVCGPAGARTLGKNGQARVYAVGRRAIGCHRDRPRSYPLGLRSPVRSVQLAGRHAAVRRVGASERLTVYDLRRARVAGQAIDRRRFTRIRLDRRGIAAYIAVREPEAPGEAPLVEVGTTADGTVALDVAIDPYLVGLAGPTVAWRSGANVRHRYGCDSHLVARLRGEKRVRIGEPISPCISASGCSGVTELEFAEPFAAVFSGALDHAGSWDSIVVYDLSTGTRRTRCSTYRVFLDDGELGAYVFTESGGVACGMQRDPYNPYGPPRRVIQSGGVVIDEGPGVDPYSLVRRGDRLVWLHDGAERSAPLPSF